MAGLWSKLVAPRLSKVFDKDGKKAAALEFLKSFNKEELDKEIEDKKTELEPKVVEAYEGSPPEVKALYKDKKPVKVTKKNSGAVIKFLEELAKNDFPGAKVVSDAVAKSGTTPLAPAVTFILEKAAPFIPIPKEEPEPAAEATPREVAVEEEKKEEPAAAAAESSEVVEEKKEEEEEKKEEEKPAETAPAPAEEEKK